MDFDYCVGTPILKEHARAPTSVSLNGYTP